MTDEGNQSCLKMKIIEYHDYKTLLGPCFISFSIPLLVPGVVLTVVGSYGNESSFPTFGAWHIIGIAILSFALLLLFSGIVLKCCYRPVISADIEQHLSPTTSMITGSKNLGYENDIYSSNSAKMHNKVSHHDLDGSHKVVSTHEAKTTKSGKGTSKQFTKNAALDGKTTKTESNRRKDAQEPSSSITTSVTTPRDSSRIVIPPPSYEELEHVEAKRKKKPEPLVIPESNYSSSVSRTMQGQVKVTAKIVAEAETVHTSAPRDLSSDGGSEQTKFLPEKKRKKKKRRKRHSNLSQQSHQSSDDNGGTSAETSARQVLPELRIHPVLVHEGSEHHHHNLHVHFQEEKERTISDSNTKDDVPDPAVYVDKVAADDSSKSEVEEKP